MLIDSTPQRRGQPTSYIQFKSRQTNQLWARSGQDVACSNVGQQDHRPRLCPLASTHCFSLPFPQDAGPGPEPGPGPFSLPGAQSRMGVELRDRPDLQAGAAGLWSGLVWAGLGRSSSDSCSGDTDCAADTETTRDLLRPFGDHAASPCSLSRHSSATRRVGGWGGGQQVHHPCSTRLPQ